MYIGFELWQVKSGTIFDNIIVTDSEQEADEFAGDIQKYQRNERRAKAKMEKVEKEQLIVKDLFKGFFKVQKAKKMDNGCFRCFFLALFIFKSNHINTGLTPLLSCAVGPYRGSLFSFFFGPFFLQFFQSQ